MLGKRKYHYSSEGKMEAAPSPVGGERDFGRVQGFFPELFMSS